MLTFLKALDWVLLRLRYPFIGRYGWTPRWLLRIHLIPKRPFLRISRLIDEYCIDREMEELC